MKITISQELCDLMEKLHYENIGLKDLIVFSMKNNIDINSNGYKKLYQDYLENNAEYELAKKELEKYYEIPSNTFWHLDFDTRELKYDE